MSDKEKFLGFKCDSCAKNFRTADYLRIDMPDRESHPYDYLATCPNCGKEEVELESWQVNLLKAWANATGPKNTELTKFNAITHGLTAKVAQYHPARPGQYDVCNGCEYLESTCGQDNNKWCLKRTEIYMRLRLASDEGDIQSLKEIHADNQAGAQIILESMMLCIMQDGVTVKTPLNYEDKKTGEIKLVDFIDETGKLKIAYSDIKAHPLLKPYIEMLSKNGLSLTDMMLTKKQQGEDANLKGFLDDEQQTREEQREKQAVFDQRHNTLIELVKGNVDPLSNVKKLGHG